MKFNSMLVLRSSGGLGYPTVQPVDVNMELVYVNGEQHVEFSCPGCFGRLRVSARDIRKLLRGGRR